MVRRSNSGPPQVHEPPPRPPVRPHPENTILKALMAEFGGRCEFETIRTDRGGVIGWVAVERRETIPVPRPMIFTSTDPDDLCGQLRQAGMGTVPPPERALAPRAESG